MNDTTPEQGLSLHANDLLSKWGFADGDLIYNFWEDTHPDESIPEIYSHSVLIELVRAHLLPALAEQGHSFIHHEISTIHNPIRLYELDGKGVDWFDHKDTAKHGVSDLNVYVPYDVVMDAINRDIEKTKAAGGRKLAAQ
jgi:hypothetical protein